MSSTNLWGEEQGKLAHVIHLKPGSRHSFFETNVPLHALLLEFRLPAAKLKQLLDGLADHLLLGHAEGLP